MSMQITRPVMQRGSSLPGVLRPIGTPASQPEPLVVFGGVLVLGVVGVVGCDDGVDGVDGFVLGAALELDELLDEVDAAAGLLVGTDVGEGAGVDGAEEVAVEEVPTPAAACCTASVLVPPEPDEHPVTPIATAPATATKTPPFPAPEVLMPLSTPEGGFALRGGDCKTDLL
jgi:hypothetical protein